MSSKKLNTLIFTFYIPLGLVLLNLILKVFFLDYGSISGDEPFTIFHAQMELKEFSEFLIHENNPPLHFILMHFWIKLFGISTFSVRFTSYVFSSLTVLFIYKLGKKHFNFRVAILTSLIFTFSNFHIYFSHETRVYALFTLLTVMSMYYFFSLLKEVNTKKYLILLIIVNTLLIYAHFFGFFVIAIQGISILFNAKFRKSALKKYTLICLATIALYIPYINIIFFRFTESSKGTWVQKPNFDELYNVLWTFSNLPINVVVFATILLSALILYLVKRKKISHQANASFIKVIIIWFLFPYLFIFIISQWIPMFLDRYLVFISVGFYFLIAISLNFLAHSKKVFYPALTVVIGLMVFTSNLKSGRPKDFENIMEMVNNNKKPNTVVYLFPSWTNYGFAYYYNIVFFKDYKQTNSLLEKENVHMLYYPNEIIDSHFTGNANAIYIHGNGSDPEGLIYKKLADKFSHVITKEEFKHYKVYFFSNK